MAAIASILVVTLSGNSGPSDGQHSAVLTRALTLIQRHYRALGSFGPPEVDYQVGELWRRGIDGSGTTIALIEAWNDPGIASFMARIDRNLGLLKAQITTIFPTGNHRLPASCPPGMLKLGNYGSCSGWAGEEGIDVLFAHLLAPYARILVAVAPPDSEITGDAASQVAPPEFMQAVEYLSVHHLANVISISDDSAESTYAHGSEEIHAQDPGELTAAANGIPVLVGTGDCDAAQILAVANARCTPGDITTRQATGVWDDSPWVTAVGGSIPDLSATGKRLGPDRVWNLAPAGSPEGEAAGFSAIYTRPGYQNSVATNTRSKWRSVPDITMDAAAGTSGSAPLLARVLALATQLNHGQNVGPINNALYNVLGPAGVKDGIADIVSGNNTLTIDGKVLVRGFTAAKGFDVVSGWGTVRANAFAPTLARATRAAHQNDAVRAQAAAALIRLEHQEQLSNRYVGQAGTTLLTAQGFLPACGQAVCRRPYDRDPSRQRTGVGQIPDQPLSARPRPGPPRRKPGQHADHDNERVPLSMTACAHTYMPARAVRATRRHPTRPRAEAEGSQLPAQRPTAESPNRRSRGQPHSPDEQDVSCCPRGVRTSRGR